MHVVILHSAPSEGRLRSTVGALPLSSWFSATGLLCLLAQAKCYELVEHLIVSLYQLRMLIFLLIGPAQVASIGQTTSCHSGCSFLSNPLGSFGRVLVLVEQSYFPTLGNLSLGKVCSMWAI